MMRSAASSATARLSASTAATGSPAQRTRSRAKRGWCTGATWAPSGTANGRGCTRPSRSGAVTTAATPGRRRAASRSMRRRTAWATVLRTTTRWRRCGMPISSTNRARPCRNRRSSRRRRGRPIQGAADILGLLQTFPGDLIVRDGGADETVHRAVPPDQVGETLQPGIGLACLDPDCQPHGRVVYGHIGQPQPPARIQHAGRGGFQLLVGEADLGGHPGRRDVNSGAERDQDVLERAGGPILSTTRGRLVRDERGEVAHYDLSGTVGGQAAVRPVDHDVLVALGNPGHEIASPERIEEPDPAGSSVTTTPSSYDSMAPRTTRSAARASAAPVSGFAPPRTQRANSSSSSTRTSRGSNSTSTRPVRLSSESVVAPSIFSAAGQTDMSVRYSSTAAVPYSRRE